MNETKTIRYCSKCKLVRKHQRPMSSAAYMECVTCAQKDRHTAFEDKKRHQLKEKLTPAE